MIGTYVRRKGPNIRGLRITRLNGCFIVSLIAGAFQHDLRLAATRARHTTGAIMDDPKTARDNWRKVCDDAGFVEEEVLP